MKATLLAAGILIGATLVGSAGADDGLDQRVTQLESTVGCMSQVEPVAVEQLHHSVKRVLVTTNGGADTFNHPKAYTWLITMDPSCAKDVAR